MGERNYGPRAILTRPEVYRWTREILGLNRWLKEYVARYIKPKTGDRILDIGCGTGEVTRYLAGAEYTGVDRHQPYIDYANHHFGKNGRFLCADVADQIEVFRGSFDIVIANGLLHHIEDHLATRLFEVGAEVLGDDGRMITMDPCRYSGQAPITRFIVDNDRGNNVRDFEEYENLARGVFPAVTNNLWHGFLPIPFSVSIVECRKAPVRLGGAVSKTFVKNASS